MLTLDADIVARLQYMPRDHTVTNLMNNQLQVLERVESGAYMTAKQQAKTLKDLETTMFAMVQRM